jgi:hypothetical protein
VIKATVATYLAVITVSLSLGYYTGTTSDQLSEVPLHRQFEAHTDADDSDSESESEHGDVSNLTALDDCKLVSIPTDGMASNNNGVYLGPRRPHRSWHDHW